MGGSVGRNSVSQKLRPRRDNFNRLHWRGNTVGKKGQRRHALWSLWRMFVGVEIRKEEVKVFARVPWCGFEGAEAPVSAEWDRTRVRALQWRWWAPGETGPRGMGPKGFKQQNLTPCEHQATTTCLESILMSRSHRWARRGCSGRTSGPRAAARGRFRSAARSRARAAATAWHRRIACGGGQWQAGGADPGSPRFPGETRHATEGLPRGTRPVPEKKEGWPTP